MKKQILISISIFALAAVALGAAQAQDTRSYIFENEDLSGGSYLGVQTENLTSDRLGELHLKEEHGVEVTMVDQDAPASKAGLKEHDVILSVNDQKIESVEQLKRVIREIPAGRTVSLGISRDGQPMTLKAQLAERDKVYDLSNSFNFTVPPVKIPAIHVPPINMPEMDFGPIVVIHSLERSGLMVENLTPQLNDFFGVKSGVGVLVRSVEKGSRGEQAGFKAGDVITKINGAEVSDCSDFTRLLRKRTDNKAAITIMRDRKEQNLTLNLPEARRTGSLNDNGVCFLQDSGECVALPTGSALMPAINMAQLRKDLARVQPDMKKLEKQYRAELLQNQGELKKQMEKMQEELRRGQEEFRKQMKDWATEI